MAPVDKEPLLLYISATNQVVSAVLVVEHDAPTHKSKGKRSGNTLPGQPSKKRTPGNDGLAESAQGSPTRKVQHPVYFVSSVLRDARERYPMM